MQVIIDRKEGEYFIGRTEYDSPEVDPEVLIKSPLPASPLGDCLRIGQFVQVQIESADEFDLYGVLND